MSESHSGGIRARLVAEMKTMLAVFIYLAALLGALTLYRRLLLNEYHIRYLHYGYNLVEALVLAKVIVFGKAFGLGERFQGHPLIIPTTYKTVYFGVLVLGLSVVEHTVTGWIHGESGQAAWDAILNQGVWEILSRVLVLFLAFLLLFAVFETGRAMGEGKLFELFFRRARSSQAGDSSTPPAADDTGSLGDRVRDDVHSAPEKIHDGR